MFKKKFKKRIFKNVIPVTSLWMKCNIFQWPITQIKMSEKKINNQNILLLASLYYQLIIISIARPLEMEKILIDFCWSTKLILKRSLKQDDRIVNRKFLE